MHLGPQDTIAAIDGTLPPALRTHLDQCETCRAAVNDLRETFEMARVDFDVPEPSPLFWDHLSTRVREATTAQWQPPRAAWWISAWKPLAAGGAAAALLWAVGAWPLHPASDPASAVVESVQTPDTWADVVARVDQLSPDDLSAVAALPPGASLLVDELTPAERDVFATLVEGELRRLQ